MKRILLHAMLLLPILTNGQQPLTLEECYRLLNTNHPLTQQDGLFQKQNEIDLEVLQTGKLPKLELEAQAVYLSDVTQVPFAPIEPLNNDQYRTTLSANQLIYAGGSIDASMKAQAAALKTQQKQVEVNLYQLKKQVNQLYFSILLVRENRELLAAKKELLVVQLKEVRSGIRNGTILPASDKVLEAELLKIESRTIELAHNETSLFQTLTSLVGISLDPSMPLQNPQIEINMPAQIARPELALFELKKEQIESSNLVLSKQNSPKLLGFATGGYGNPGLNMLDNSFQTFYTLGLKLNWNVFDWQANQKKRASLLVNKELVDNESELFELATRIELNQQQSEMEKLTAFITSDSLSIQLRKEVLKSAESQLRNGVITSSAFVTELTNLFEDENTLSMHRIQLELVKANYNTTKGQ
ncbi:MAG: TolC family protein [Cyclobacteriaceae bacterium]